MYELLLTPLPLLFHGGEGGTRKLTIWMWSLAAEVALLLFLDNFFFFFACLTPGTQDKVPCKENRSRI